jgi:N,N-dimethylformamidase
MDIVGYTKPVVSHGGEAVECMVSTTSESYRARLVRLTGGDGEVTTDGWAAPLELPGRWQGYPRGSYLKAQLPSWPAWMSGGAAMQCWFFPTLLEGRQCLMSLDGEEATWDIEIDDDTIAFRQIVPGVTPDGPAGPGVLMVNPLRLRPDRWYFVAVSIDCERGRVGLAAARAAVPGHPSPGLETSWSDTSISWSIPRTAFVAASAAEGPAVRHFNGKIDSPRLFARSLPDSDFQALAQGAGPHSLGGLAAAWRFDPVHDSNSGMVEDTGPMRAHGELVNQPILAVTGRNWTGAHVDFGQAPDEYRAAYFHADDLADCAWAADFAFRVSDDLPSGVYGVELETSTARDVVPFIVSASLSRGPVAPLAVLLPTFSYLAYANEHASWLNPIGSTGDLERLAAAIGPADRWMAEEELNSIYDRHRDGTGVCLSSWLRPVLNFRHDYSMPLVRGPHQLPADMELLRWLDAEGIAHEVITDDDLHRSGSAALTRFRAIVTGSHPEYWSPEMLTGLDQYLAVGGRLVYLGGNGFYWVTICPAGRTDTIEVRRGRSGTRVWESAPGEEHHAFRDERGGAWRNRGWAPQRVAGVGFTAQGFDVSLPYRWAITAEHPEAGFIVAGIDTTGPLGTEGSVLGGAAGFEIDRADERLGTPPETVLVASATGFSDAYQGAIEDVTTADSRQGGSVSELVRSDIIFMTTEGGGAVFSVGSIAWCGALSSNGGKNDVARATRNVLERFADPGGFANTVDGRG